MPAYFLERMGDKVHAAVFTPAMQICSAGFVTLLYKHTLLLRLLNHVCCAAESVQTVGPNLLPDRLTDIAPTVEHTVWLDCGSVKGLDGLQQALQVPSADATSSPHASNCNVGRFEADLLDILQDESADSSPDGAEALLDAGMKWSQQLSAREMERVQPQLLQWLCALPEIVSDTTTQELSSAPLNILLCRQDMQVADTASHARETRDLESRVAEYTATERVLLEQKQQRVRRSIVCHTLQRTDSNSAMSYRLSNAPSFAACSRHFELNSKPPPLAARQLSSNESSPKSNLHPRRKPMHCVESGLPRYAL